MPKSGGVHRTSVMQLLDPMGSFICTWTLALSYIGVVCFEA